MKLDIYKILNKKSILIILPFLFIAVAGIFLYSKYVSPTYIGLVRFSDFQYSRFLDVETGGYVRIKRIDMDSEKIPNMSRYRIVYIWVHGFNAADDFVKAVEKAKKSGTKFYMIGANNPETDLTNISGDDLKNIAAYFSNGGSENFSRLFNYTRRILDKKIIGTKEIEPAVIIPSEGFFHVGEENYFSSYEEFTEFYKNSGKYNKSNPKVALFTSNLGPTNSTRSHIDMLITKMEEKGLSVIPVMGFRRRIEFLKEVKLDLAVIMPHGRFSPGRHDELIAYLTANNIPLLAPVNVFSPYDEWLKDQKGMTGGMLSQSIAVPEMDGAIEALALSALKKNHQNLNVFFPIPERIEKFSNKAANWAKLKKIGNNEKKVAVFYYKGPGLNAMTAGGLEVAPSLLNLLRELQKQGYNTGKLPSNDKELMAVIQKQGPVFGAYAKGAVDLYLKNGNPEMIEAETYKKWAYSAMPADLFKDVLKKYGEPSGDYMAVKKDDKYYMAVSRVQFGNVVILPQPIAGHGEDEFAVIHGTKEAPPHSYIAPYLWAKYGFKADALMHFGTHGSLEFTPYKQPPLSNYDWSDVLTGDLPHVYLYVINNIGEAIIAKRRSYAVITSHITPPFTKSELYGDFKILHDLIHDYEVAGESNLKDEYVKSITAKVLNTDIDKDLGFSDLSGRVLSENEMEKLHNYIHTIENEKINAKLYTLGEHYTAKEKYETALMISVDPVSYSLANIDLAKGLITDDIFNNMHDFEKRYIERAEKIINEVIHKGRNSAHFISASDISYLEYLKDDTESTNKEIAHAVKDLKDAIDSIPRIYKAIDISTDEEMKSIVNALSGGYIPPSTGGDPVKNPNSIPSGKNLYGIDPENTPNRESWNVGRKLAEQLITAKINDTGEFPKKVAFTLWGGEFIRDQGTTIAQIFYLLGVEPVWNSVGRVHDVRLIPMERLKRPRIDVVVQTSGQFRDIAASRIFLINKAVKLAQDADDSIGEYVNYVKQGTEAAVKVLIENGFTPKEARAFSMARVFGGVNGNYGTNIMGLVESGDKWEDDSEITKQYLKNMGAVYTEENWGYYRPGLFEGALQNTDTVVHSRSSNTSGPLSLDHVYEFMGGLNAVVRNVTGNDPAAYFSDTRSSSRGFIQGVKEAIWTEARTTLYNPKYISEMTKGGASSAAVFAETFRNTYGWNVMKPAAVDNELWNGLYDIYIKDSYDLKIREFFEDINPYALQEMTAVMLETIRKEYWNASPEMIKELAELHAELVKDHNAGCSGFVCDNIKLQEMIKDNLDNDLKESYQDLIDKVRNIGGREEVKGMVLEKEKLDFSKIMEMIEENKVTAAALFIILLTMFGIIAFGIVRKRV